MGKTDHHDDTIQISTASGKIKCKYKSDGSTADSHKAHRGDYVKWSCDEGSYTIVFGQHSPFANPCYSKKKGEVLSIPVNSNRKTQGTYKYSVVVEQDVNDHLVRDPEILID